MSDDLLLHVCCAPCLTATAPALAAEGWSLTGFFRNPNIHPLSEWRRRRDALASFAPAIGLEILFDDAYPLEENLRELLGAGGSRCAACYRDRLGAAAARAADLGFGFFTSTLLLSPWQDHGLLRAAGEEAAGISGVEFVYRDLRPHYRESVAISRAAGMYRQPYCGCIFSERDRYSGKTSSRKGEAHSGGEVPKGG